MPSLITFSDISDDSINRVLARARELHAARRDDKGRGGRRHILSLAFFEPSLRTRAGYTAAATRLGWQTIEVLEPRGHQSGSIESWPDTLRVLAGYSDIVVARPGQPLGDEDRSRVGHTVLINGGDTGPTAEHPSQALVDLFAIEQIVGPIGDLHIALVGDPGMRVVRSLLALLSRRPPGAITLLADPGQIGDAARSPALRNASLAGSWDELTSVDVVYVAGIPHQSLPLERREFLLATSAKVRLLPERAVLLSPMPVIDEMDSAVRESTRNKMFEQSALGLYMRMALLEHMVEGGADAPG